MEAGPRVMHCFSAYSAEHALFICVVGVAGAGDGGDHLRVVRLLPGLNVVVIGAVVVAADAVEGFKLSIRYKPLTPSIPRHLPSCDKLAHRGHQ